MNPKINLKDVPKDRPLKSIEISEFGLLGKMCSVRVRQIIKDPENGFKLINMGGTAELPRYGVMFSDIERYWKKKVPVPIN